MKGLIKADRTFVRCSWPSLRWHETRALICSYQALHLCSSVFPARTPPLSTSRPARHLSAPFLRRPAPSARFHRLRARAKWHCPLRANRKRTMDAKNAVPKVAVREAMVDFVELLAKALLSGVGVALAMAVAILALSGGAMAASNTVRINDTRTGTLLFPTA